jgi:hypothetical protein
LVGLGEVNVYLSQVEFASPVLFFRTGITVLEDLRTGIPVPRAGLRSSRAPGSLFFGAPQTSIRAKNKRKTVPAAGEIFGKNGPIAKFS